MDRSWNSTATRITAKQWELEQQISCYIVYNTCKERRSVFPEELACKSLFSFSFTQHIFQNNNFFFQTQDYHIETFNNTGTELFLWCVTNIRVRLKKIKLMRWYSVKKYQKVSNVVKKTQTFRVYDPSSCLENCWANFKTFSGIQDSVRITIQEISIVKCKFPTK